jgi:hypothetical protein
MWLVFPGHVAVSSTFCCHTLNFRITYEQRPTLRLGHLEHQLSTRATLMLPESMSCWYPAELLMVWLTPTPRL